jgi:hypothetical protein
MVATVQVAMDALPVLRTRLTGCAAEIALGAPLQTHERDD